MVQRHQRAQFAFRVAMTNNFDRAARAKAGAQARRIFHRIHKYRIQRQAGAPQRNKGNRRRAIRSGRQHPRRRPGRFTHKFLAIQHGNAQIASRQIERHRSADDAPANDHDIVRFHANILSAISSTGFSLWVFACQDTNAPSGLGPPQAEACATIQASFGAKFGFCRKFPASLKRFDEFRGKHARLFGQVLSAHPIIGHDGFVRLAEESFDFFRQDLFAPR